jgi:dihydroorotase
MLLTGGRVIDPANGFDAVADVLLEGKIAAVGPAWPPRRPPQTPRFDATGLVVCPGLIDLHAHLREPGQSAKETIATGTAAAARGGFASVVCMPNTSPAIDNAGTVALIRERAERERAWSMCLWPAPSPRTSPARNWRPSARSNGRGHRHHRRRPLRAEQRIDAPRWNTRGCSICR